MNEEHDRQEAARKRVRGAGDVQVQALVLVLLECLHRDDVLGETEQVFLESLARRLRADGSAKREILRWK